MVIHQYGKKEITMDKIEISHDVLVQMKLTSPGYAESSGVKRTFLLSSRQER